MATLLQINGLKKWFGSKVIFNDANLIISDRQKVAVIGRNGAGKSTLLKMIIGELNVEDGQISVPIGTRIGYLTQHDPFEQDEIVWEFLMRASGKPDWQCGKVAAQFQIKEDLLRKRISELSGGYQMRIKLIVLLLDEPNLLLLDEPTNYLDIATQILLEEFLRNYKGAFMLVSHDREFVENTCEYTLEVENGKLTLFKQRLSYFLEHKELQILTAQNHNRNVEKQRKHLQKFVDRFGSKATKASAAQSKMKQIERLETIEIEHPLSTTRIKLPRLIDREGTVLETDNLVIGYPDKIVAKNINLRIERAEHVAIVGDNGHGKTTLLKTLAGALNKIDGVFKWAGSVKIGYYAQHVPLMLDGDLTVREHLELVAPEGTTDQQIFEMAGNFLFKNEELDKSIKVLSGGEKARLCLAGMLLDKNEVLLLDEPTNHLDFETVEALAESLSESNATVIFVSHDRTFIEKLADNLIEVKNGKVVRHYVDFNKYIECLKKEIIEDLSEINIENVALNKVNKKLERKKIKQLEREMEKLEKEKADLLQWFLDNAGDYAPAKTERLAMIESEILELEEQWLECQSVIE